MDSGSLARSLLLAGGAPIAAICAHIGLEDLGQLACVARWRDADTDNETLWRLYFLLHWGVELGVTRHTAARVVRYWSDDALPGTWAFTVAFCRASSALDHLFWFLPVARHAMHVKALKHNTEACAMQRPALAWHAACRAKVSVDGAARVHRCIVCDTLEVMPMGQSLQHSKCSWTRWTQPCVCSPLVAHRACLERQWALKHRCAIDKELTCGVCGTPFKPAWRFPETFHELVAATAQEWRWVLRRVFVLLALFVWMQSLTAHYASQKALQELWPMLVFMAALSSIPTTERFHVSMQKIWNTPHRQKFFLLFGFFLFQTYAISLRALEPEQWAFVAEHFPMIKSLHKAHVELHESRVGKLLFAAVSTVYAICASGIIFLFWKTSLRVPTVADVDDVSRSGLGKNFVGNRGPHLRIVRGANDSTDIRSPRRPCADCGLCQLGLCLDNTCK